MLADAHVFLDVDDLTEGRGAEYIDASSATLRLALTVRAVRSLRWCAHRYVDLSAATLVFCSKGYFQSVNCMRESTLLRAIDRIRDRGPTISFSRLSCSLACVVEQSCARW